MTQESMPKKSNRTGLYAAAIIIIAIIIGVSVYYVWMSMSSSPPATPNVTTILYEGEISTANYGFGNSASSLTSPGPTLTYKVGDVVNITIFNVGAIQHGWEISNQNSTSGNVMFNAQIPTINPGSSANNIFTVTQAGNFYYICPIPGHTDLGMWGNVVVNAS